MDDLMVWVDIETTGLDPMKDDILEVGMIVTNLKLQVLSSAQWLCGFNSLHKEDKIARRAIAHGWDDFIKEMHTKSGLMEDWVQNPLYNENGLEKTIEDWLGRFNFTEKPWMTGNNIPFDRSFLKYHVPDIEAMFQYRNLDISSIKNAYKVEREILLRTFSSMLTENDVPEWVTPKDRVLHRPIADLEVSIMEYKFYREHFFR